MIEVDVIGYESKYTFIEVIKSLYNDKTIEIIDVKYSTTTMQNGYHSTIIVFTAMIIFKRKEQTND